MLTGHSPEVEGIVTYDIDQLELQLVEPDLYEGWNVAPDKFAFSHVGYRPVDPKVALVDTSACKHFQLIDQNGNEAFSGKAHVVKNQNGVFHQLDFSDLRKTEHIASAVVRLNRILFQLKKKYGCSLYLKR